MFITKEKIREIVKEEIENITPEDIGLVKCEHSGLYGKKRSMKMKIVRVNSCSSWSIFPTVRDVEIYYSPVFSPEWDIKDETVTPTKYYRIEERKEVEIKATK